MRSINVQYYDGQSSCRHSLRLALDEHGVLHPCPALFSPIALAELSIESRLGRLSRRLHCPNGGVIETDDHRVLDDWLKQHQPEHGWIHKLESSWRVVVASVVIIACFVAWFAIYGIPRLSEKIAYSVPSELSAMIGEGVLESLDSRVFKLSTLSEVRQAELMTKFQVLLPNPNTTGFNFNLQFRGGGVIGANAFALPDGTVVVTDELVELADRDEEILSVLLHEIGHVIHRHSLRQALSHAGLGIMMSLIIGDVSFAGTIIYALPNVLMESAYSRDHEWDADDYALRRMQARGMNPQAFVDIMQKLAGVDRPLAAREPNKPEETAISSERREVDQASSGSGSDEDSDHKHWLNYLSTHPATADRIKRFQQAASP